MEEEIKQKAGWEVEYEKQLENNENALYWASFRENIPRVKEFISQALQKRDEEIIKMLGNTDVQMSVNGDVSKDEIAMAKFIYKAHIKHIIKNIESAIIPPNSINGTLPSETDSATK